LILQTEICEQTEKILIEQTIPRPYQRIEVLFEDGWYRGTYDGKCTLFDDGEEIVLDFSNPEEKWRPATIRGPRKGVIPK
jgi:hypothetical protein